MNSLKAVFYAPNSDKWSFGGMYFCCNRNQDLVSNRQDIINCMIVSFKQTPQRELIILLQMFPT